MKNNFLTNKKHEKKPLTKITKKRIFIICIMGILMLAVIAVMVLAILSANNIVWY